MPLIAPKAQVSKQLEPGTYIARCYSMVHIGTSEFEYQGETKKSNKIRISFEFPTETEIFKEGEPARPYVLSTELSFSLHEKSKLRPILESWRGKKFTEDELGNFDLANLIGVPAMVSVVEGKKGYSEIATITRPPKGNECPAQVNKSQLLTYDDWNEELFLALPEFLRKKIEASDEYKKMKGLIGEELPKEVNPNDIPF